MGSRKRDHREPSADERALTAVNEQLDKAVATYADPTGTGRPDADNLAAFIKVYVQSETTQRQLQQNSRSLLALSTLD